MNKVLMSLILITFSTAAYSANCKVQSTDSTSKKIITYGEVAITQYPDGVEFGEMQSETFDMADEQHAKKTARVQVTVTKESAKSPYEISYWLMSKDRNAETLTVVKTKHLPFETRIHLQINKNSNPDVSNSAGYVDIICK